MVENKINYFIQKNQYFCNLLRDAVADDVTQLCLDKESDVMLA